MTANGRVMIEGKKTQLKFYCSTVEIIFALGQLLHVTGIEETCLTIREYMKKAKDTCSKDLKHLGRIDGCK